ncbi:MAG: serine hydrolase [Lewinellaceae bacterium]|nr:serine hydrolase [Lewinellaceae bacterium]
MRKILVAAWMVFSTISCHQSTVAERESAAESVKETITQELVQIHQRGYINGFSVAIVNENQLLYATGIGYGNSETREPYTEQTIQNIGSISKTLIGIALLKAQEMGN